MSIAMQQALGAIEAETVYPLSVFSRLVGLDENAMRQARRRGLKVRRVGRRGYVVGRDWLDFVTAEPNQ